MLGGGELEVPAGTEFDVDGSDDDVYFCECLSDALIEAARQQELKKLVTKPEFVRSKFLGISRFEIPRALVERGSVRIAE